MIPNQVCQWNVITDHSATIQILYVIRKVLANYLEQHSTRQNYVANIFLPRLKCCSRFCGCTSDSRRKRQRRSSFVTFCCFSRERFERTVQKRASSSPSKQHSFFTSASERLWEEDRARNDSEKDMKRRGDPLEKNFWWIIAAIARSS